MNCFIRLKGSLEIFRKSHEVLALNFDPFGVHLHVETNLVHYNPQCCQLIINITRVIIQTQIFSKNRPNTGQNRTFKEKYRLQIQMRENRIEYTKLPMQNTEYFAKKSSLAILKFIFSCDKSSIQDDVRRLVGRRHH